MIAGRSSRTLLAIAALAAATVAVPLSASSPVAAAPFDCATAATPLCGGGEYHAIAQPVRVFDSRVAGNDNPAGQINDVPPFGTKPMGAASVGTAKYDVDLLGLATGGAYQHPWLGGTQVDAASDVLAVVANVTLVNPTQDGFLKVYAAGETEPNASLLNFTAGRNFSNLGIIRPNADGKVTVALRGGATGGTADFVIDVFGWISTSSYTVDPALPAAPANPYGSRLVTVDPGRILDTRISPGAIGSTGRLRVPIRGATDITNGAVVVPNDPSVTGVVLNLTGVTPTAPTFLSVVPNDPGGAAPTTSNVNMLPGAVKANLVVVPVNPATGDIWIYNNLGNTDVVVDVVGYLQKAADETTRAGRIVPLTTPFRAFDTREALFGSAPLGPRQAEDWSFAAFSASVNIGGTSVGNQQALIGNLTNAVLNRANPRVATSSYLTVYPSPGGVAPVPTVSNLNTVDPSVDGPLPVPNMAVVRYGGNQVVRVYNHDGYADYLLDVSAVVLAD
jgi:hypothetical protein